MILNKLPQYVVWMSNATKWIFAIIAVFTGLVMLFFAMAVLMLSTAITTAGSDTYEDVSGTGLEKVAIIEIDEPIVESREIIRKIKKYRNRSSVKAIVLRLNSPGGGVVPSHEIYEEVLRTRGRGKPVVASMGSVAASGAYYIACGANIIVANPGSLTGSIGVISQFNSFQELLTKIGIESTTIKSGKFKDIGNPARSMREDEIRQLQGTINNVYEQFVSVVVKGRLLSDDSVRILADGRIYSGEQAYNVGLVDTLGTLQTAISIAGTLGKIEGEPKITREVKREPLFDQLFQNTTTEAIEDVRVLLDRPPLEYRLDIR